MKRSHYLYILIAIVAIYYWKRPRPNIPDMTSESAVTQTPDRTIPVPAAEPKPNLIISATPQIAASPTQTHPGHRATPKHKS